MSKHLVSLKAGDTIDLKGPYVKFPYEANKTANLVLVAGN